MKELKNKLMFTSQVLKIRGLIRRMVSNINHCVTLFVIENDVFKMYSQEEIENFRCIFDMFDKDRTGYVNIEDL